MSGKDTVRSAARVLQVLESVSIRGTVDLAGLQETTELPKSTIVRLLHTLIEAGYVRQVSRLGAYTLTERVVRLSAGFTHADGVVAIARSHLHRFTATYKWPVGIATYHRGALRLRYGTYDRSPMTTNIPILDRRMPMFATAHGRVYFAFCSETERKLILETLRKSPHAINLLARDQRSLRAIIRDVRAKGYSLRTVMPRDRISGLAVPVLNRDIVVATISMRFFRSAMTPAEAVSSHLKPMQDLAAAIAADFNR